MPRRISNILSYSPDVSGVEAMEATIFRIWHNTFPHLPHHFGPGWSYDLVTEHKERTKLLRMTNFVTKQDKFAERLNKNKRIIILTIIDAFSPDRITANDFQFSKCCSAAPLPNPGVNAHLAFDTRVLNLLSVLQSDDSQLAQLCAIVKHVPHLHLTRVLGQLFIRRFPHLQFRSKKDVDQTQIDQAIAAFLKRSHWHCRCGFMCSKLKHPCSVI